MALLCLVALVTFHNRAALSDVRPVSLTLSPGRTPTYSQKTGEPDPEAHKLPWADSFRAHFGAVTRLKGVTMAEAKAACRWPQGEYVNFQYGPDTE